MNATERLLLYENLPFISARGKVWPPGWNSPRFVNSQLVCLLPVGILNWEGGEFLTWHWKAPLGEVSLRNYYYYYYYYKKITKEAHLSQIFINKPLLKQSREKVNWALSKFVVFWATQDSEKNLPAVGSSYSTFVMNLNSRVVL